jgi:hypothetical protein
MNIQLDPNLPSFTGNRLNAIENLGTTQVLPQYLATAMAIAAVHTKALQNFSLPQVLHPHMPRGSDHEESAAQVLWN